MKFAGTQSCLFIYILFQADFVLQLQDDLLEEGLRLRVHNLEIFTIWLLQENYAWDMLLEGTGNNLSK